MSFPSSVHDLMLPDAQGGRQARDDLLRGLGEIVDRVYRGRVQPGCNIGYSQEYAQSIVSYPIGLFLTSEKNTDGRAHVADVRGSAEGQCLRHMLSALLNGQPVQEGAAPGQPDFCRLVSSQEVNLLLHNANALLTYIHSENKGVFTAPPPNFPGFANLAALLSPPPQPINVAQQAYERAYWTLNNSLFGGQAGVSRVGPSPMGSESVMIQCASVEAAQQVAHFLKNTYGIESIEHLRPDGAAPQVGTTPNLWLSQAAFFTLANRLAMAPEVAQQVYAQPQSQFVPQQQPMMQPQQQPQLVPSQQPMTPQQPQFVPQTPSTGSWGGGAVASTSHTPPVAPLAGGGFVSHQFYTAAPVQGRYTPTHQEYGFGKISADLGRFSGGVTGIHCERAPNTTGVLIDCHTLPSAQSVASYVKSKGFAVNDYPTGSQPSAKLYMNPKDFDELRGLLFEESGRLAQLRVQPPSSRPGPPM